MLGLYSTISQTDIIPHFPFVQFSGYIFKDLQMKVFFYLTFYNNYDILILGVNIMNNFSTKKVRKLYILFIVISCLLLVFGLLKTMWGLAVVGWFIMACAVFFYLVCYRCHNCGKFLGRDSVKHCPHCGSEVE